MKFKVGDLVRHFTGLIGLVMHDPKDRKTLVVRITPFIFGKLIEDEWELLQLN